MLGVMGVVLATGVAVGTVGTALVQGYRFLSQTARDTQTQANLAQAQARLVLEHAPSGLGVLEPPAMLTGAGGAADGGVVPAASAAVKSDGYGGALGYCAYFNGPGAAPAGYIQGQASATGAEISFILISAGRNRQAETTCAQAAGGAANGDDKVLVTTLADVANRSTPVGAGGSSSGPNVVQAQQIACAASGKLFAGLGAQGAEANGCISPASTGGVVQDQNGNLAGSCKDVKSFQPSAVSGTYQLIGMPNGTSTPHTWNAVCDMATAGGAWTLLAAYDPTAPCPAQMIQGGVCYATGQPIILTTPSYVSQDMASPRMLTGALIYLQGWQEIMLVDANGRYTMFQTGSPVPKTITQVLNDYSQNFYDLYVFFQTGHSGPITQNLTTPAWLVRPTGWYEPDPYAYTGNTCHDGSYCPWSYVQQFDPSVNWINPPWNQRKWYWAYRGLGFEGLPPNAFGFTDYQGRVCRSLNGCTQGTAGPGATLPYWSGGNTATFSYTTDYLGNGGDVDTRMPMIPHLNPGNTTGFFVPNYSINLRSPSSQNIGNNTGCAAQGTPGGGFAFTGYSNNPSQLAWSANPLAGITSGYFGQWSDYGVAVWTNDAANDRIYTVGQGGSYWSQYGPEEFDLGGSTWPNLPQNPAYLCVSQTFLITDACGNSQNWNSNEITYGGYLSGGCAAQHLGGTAQRWSANGLATGGQDPTGLFVGFRPADIRRVYLR